MRSPTVLMFFEWGLLRGKTVVGLLAFRWVLVLKLHYEAWIWHGDSRFELHEFDIWCKNHLFSKHPCILRKPFFSFCWKTNGESVKDFVGVGDLCTCHWNCWICFGVVVLLENWRKFRQENLVSLAWRNWSWNRTNCHLNLMCLFSDFITKTWKTRTPQTKKHPTRNK